MRRVNCPICGVTVERVPWAEGKCHLTTSYRWFLAGWAKYLSWQEVKVAFFYSEDAKRQHVAFTHGNHVVAGKLLRREADRLRFQKADQRVGLVDGATWIREQMQLHFAELEALGLDFYHLSEKRSSHAAQGVW